ncbi:DUF6894 family protein [Microvirga lotononidis]|uniref:DUF6894 domain-containing protein n=1 Tax=Microvirga lotononidis TaxID=864069 RepID=I4YKD7_9HYPH|nr:hypothetical protein [Microvirga lotononidis]EIM24429.1 hypothetical protein MicloDRAFT_00069480 [Microvirga lotononidis]WQO31352.1 hypothetical protein U0023_34265 [Microvirga lotononidis]
MPRFYFDVRQGSNLIPDPEGFECASLEAAEHEAMQTALQLGRDALAHSRHLSVEVKNERYQPVLAVTIGLTIERLAPWLG